jgi:hypothetical protein
MNDCIDESGPLLFFGHAPSRGAAHYSSEYCAKIFACCVCAQLLGHAAFLRLPFFWDEAGQFVPAALDRMT